MPDSNTSLTGLYECLLTEKQQEELQGLELSLTNKLINNQLLAALFRRHAEQALRERLLKVWEKSKAPRTLKALRSCCKMLYRSYKDCPTILRAPWSFLPYYLKQPTLALRLRGRPGQKSFVLPAPFRKQRFLQELKENLLWLKRCEEKLPVLMKSIGWGLF